MEVLKEIIFDGECPDKDLSSVLLIIPCEKTFNLSFSEKLAYDLSKNFRVLVYSSSLPSSLEVDNMAEIINKELITKKIKRVTIFSSGGGCNLGVSLSVNYLGLVRRISFLDPELRVNSSLIERIIDKIESLLPLGLPLRPLNSNYDPRPIIHRLRCPVFLISSEEISLRSKNELNFLNRRIPNSIKKNISYKSQTLATDIKDLLTELILKPVKRPQKNLS